MYSIKMRIASRPFLVSPPPHALYHIFIMAISDWMKKVLHNIDYNHLGKCEGRKKGTKTDLHLQQCLVQSNQFRPIYSFASYSAPAILTPFPPAMQFAATTVTTMTTASSNGLEHLNGSDISWLPQTSNLLLTQTKNVPSSWNDREY